MMATDELGVDLDGADVIIIGAGQMASGIARRLARADRRAFVASRFCNRTARARARRLRDELGDHRVAVAHARGRGDTHHHGRDSSSAAVEVPSPILTRERPRRCSTRRRSSSTSGCREPSRATSTGLANVRRIDIGDLRERVGAGAGRSPRGHRRGAAPSSTSDVEKFLERPARPRRRGDRERTARALRRRRRRARWPVARMTSTD